jgi:uncharacterized protein (TIRG00374 family)
MRWLPRVLVSLILIAILIYVAQRNHVQDRLRQVPPQDVAVAIALLGVAWIINSLRWKLLLAVAGVRERFATLASLYFIGMFFSQLLPTGAGGDPVRIWDLYRRGHKPAAVVVATLQERLLGMAVSMVVGLIAVGFYYHQLPPALAPVFVAMPIAAICGVGVFLYPRLPLSIAAKIGSRPVFANIGRRPIIHRLTAAIRPAADLPPLTPARLLPIVLVTLAGDLLSFFVWYLLARSVGVPLGFGAYCLIIPLVWVISMAPSLGGAGVREGGFVGLMKLFNVPIASSVAVAALFLIVQLLLAAVGGLLLAGRVLSGNWKPPRATRIDTISD